MGLSNGKCSYCEEKLPAKPTTEARGGVTLAFCDELCQGLWKKTKENKTASKGLRFNVISSQGRNDFNDGGNRTPANDVEAMRDRLDQ